jgi:mono/diheme cytochrome c family protein
VKLNVAAFIFVIAIAVSAIAASPQGDGKELYRSNCKVCHDKGSKNGTYTPMTLVQDQWKRFFSSKLTPSHKEVLLPDGRHVLDTLTPEQLKSIQKFCVDHAADSEQPATCG